MEPEIFEVHNFSEIQKLSYNLFYMARNEAERKVTIKYNGTVVDFIAEQYSQMYAELTMSDMKYILSLTDGRNIIFDGSEFPEINCDENKYINSIIQIREYESAIDFFNEINCAIKNSEFVTIHSDLESVTFPSKSFQLMRVKYGELNVFLSGGIIFRSNLINIFDCAMCAIGGF
ncbi:hypothetical protein [Microcystis phage Mel-JY01]